MIIRQYLLHHGRRALAAQPARQWQRFLSSEIESVEKSLQTSLQEAKAIESILNSQLRQPTSSIDTSTPVAATKEDNVAEDWYAFKRQEGNVKHLGASVEPHYRPHTVVTNPPPPSDITLELLLASQSHIGHSTSVWHPGNARYIFGIREGVHVISLDATAAYLRRAAKVVREVARRGGLILFVGTRVGQDRCVVKAAELAGGCHLFERWIPGSITNGDQLLARCRMMVVDEFDNEVPGFDDQLESRAVLKPDLVVCLNPMENYTLLHECAQHNIPTIGIIDTNANPAWVTYPVPANDDSLRCVQLIAGVLGRAGGEGKRLRLEAAQRNEYTFTASKGLQVPSSRKQGVTEETESLDELLKREEGRSGDLGEGHLRLKRDDE